MGINLYREYRLKFYLNARHYIIINGHKGDAHPHTWEFTLYIRFGRSSFEEFNTFERGISSYLAPFQNALMNEKEPFDTIMPTLENMTDYFSKEFYRVIHDVGGILVQIEASETPTRSYVVNLTEQEGNEERNRDTEKKIRADVMDAVLDNIIK